MNRTMWSVGLVGALVVLGATVGGGRQLPRGVDGGPPAGAAVSGLIDVTVNEGTSMAVAVSPDGRTLAMDLQGSIWTLPATGGAAKRITGLFEDARQPTWSPDGRTIAFFGFRDGGYDIWAISPDGTNQRKLTWGPFDDREPAFSHDGTKLAFASDRGNPLGSDYNIWVLELTTGALTQVTRDPDEDYMPSWSPDDRQIAFISERGDKNAVWVASAAGGGERQVSTAAGVANAPSWGPAGQIVHHVTDGGQSRLELDGKSLTGAENVFAFRPSWASATEFFYSSDGKIRKRAIGAGSAQTVEFTAGLQVRRASYTRKVRDFDSQTPRQAAGIVRPVLSPDGGRVAFAALNDIYVMPIGGKPENITRDQAFDTDPAWSPDGARLAYSSDKGGDQLQIWIHDTQTGQSRQLTRMTTQPQGAAWSPDGRRIAVFNVTGMWRVAEFSVIDVANGQVTKVHETLPQPGAPTWSPDGQRLAIAGTAPFSTRFREGTNQVLTMSSASAGSDRWFAPIPTLSIDSRGGCGPVWSPDGTKMAAIYEGVLSVWPVAPTGEPLGPPRRVTTESANSPSWAGDSKRLLYLHYDKLKIVDIETNETRDVPLDLKYTADVPKGRVIVHASTLVDGKAPVARTDMDIVIEGNRIRSIQPHAANRHTGGTVVDASNLTVMPGLIEFHSHLQPDFGEAQGRAWLAFGITTVRSPGGVPYEAVEEREATDANLRPGPRVYSTGHLMEYMRVYYKMGIAIATPAHLELELQRAKVLQYDLLKSYVRMTDLQQNRIVQFGHSIGVPVSGHEIYPAAFEGMDGTEHTAGTSRRGYSPKVATLQRSYGDVSTIWGKAGMVWSPMISGTGTTQLYHQDPARRQDPRFKLYPGWIQQQVSGQSVAGGQPNRGPLDMVLANFRAGTKVVAGTDGPNAFNLHGELLAYTMAGMTPYEALRAATVIPAEALRLDAGSIEVGKLADLVIVDGNPLENIAATLNVKQVVKNGRVYTMDDLLKGTTSAQGTSPTSSAAR